jgi:hypothetical protein
MFLARDRNRFSREIQSLVGRDPKKSKPVDESVERMRVANEALETVVKPLFETYADMVRQVGRSCEVKLLPGSAESHPRRLAMADFLVELSGVPGLSEFYLHLENEGGDWQLSTRPRLDGKGRPYDVGEMTLPSGKKLPAAIEGALQQFIRLTF